MTSRAQRKKNLTENWKKDNKSKLGNVKRDLKEFPSKLKVIVELKKYLSYYLDFVNN